MPKYPPERKQAVMAKLAAPGGPSIPELARSEGISEPTLYNWRKEARASGLLIPDADAGPADWTARDRFNAVLEAAGLPEADLMEYCRQRGLYPEQLQRWREAAQRGCDFNAVPPVPQKQVDRIRREDRKKIEQLQRELTRKEKALAETAALLVLRKKLDALLGGEVE